MRLFILLFFSLSIFWVHGIADAKWVKVESENFELTGYVKAKQGEKLVRELEVYRAALFKLLGQAPESEPIKVQILAVKDADGIETILGTKAVSGMYSPTREGPYFVLNAKKGFDRNARARHTAIHEYTHHVISAYTNQHYPTWYNEGYADYLTTFEEKGDRIDLGKPAQRHAYSLTAKYWMPWDIVFGSIRKYPFKLSNSGGPGITDQSQFYAQSWLAVHYILSTEGYPQKFKAYNQKINSGVKARKAFQDSFGQTPDEFGKVLKAYHKANRFTYLKISDLDYGALSEIHSKDITEREFLDAQIRFLLKFTMPNKMTDQAQALISKLEQAGGSAINIGRYRAELSFRNNDYGKAIELAETALKISPEDVETHYILGSTIVHRALFKNGRITDEEQKTARRHLKKMLLSNGDHAGAHLYYALSHGQFYKIPNKQSVASAEFALSYFLTPEFAEGGLNLGTILMLGEKFDAAAFAANFALVWSKEPRAHTRAKDLLKEIEKERNRQ